MVPAPRDLVRSGSPSLWTTDLARRAWKTSGMQRRFLTLADVTEILNISTAQAYTLLQSGELVGIQVGPRRIWRVEEAELEAYIQRMYAETRARTRAAQHAAGGGPEGDAEG